MARARARIERGPAPPGTVAGGVLLLGLALAALLLRLGLTPPACGFRALTGEPCLTCGSTRLLEALLHGDLVGAFLWNPLVFLAGTAVALWSLLSTGRWLHGRPPLRPRVSRGGRTILRIAAVVTLLAGWAYLVRQGI